MPSIPSSQSSSRKILTDNPMGSVYDKLKSSAGPRGFMYLGRHVPVQVEEDRTLFDDLDDLMAWNEAEFEFKKVLKRLPVAEMETGAAIQKIVTTPHIARNIAKGAADPLLATMHGGATAGFKIAAANSKMEEQYPNFDNHPTVKFLRDHVGAEPAEWFRQLLIRTMR